jgi:hypothetical protein
MTQEVQSKWSELKKYRSELKGFLAKGKIEVVFGPIIIHPLRKEQCETVQKHSLTSGEIVVCYADK